MAAPMVEAECAVMYPAAKSAPEEMPPMETSFGEEERRGSGAGALVVIANIVANIAMNLLVPSEHLMFAPAITALYIACVAFGQT